MKQEVVTASEEAAGGDHWRRQRALIEFFSARPGAMSRPSGKPIEHWDVLKAVGDRENSAPWYAPNVPHASPNDVF